MSLNSNSLISLEELRIYTGKAYPISSATSGSFEMSINASSQYIENYLGRNLMSGSTIQERFAGNGKYEHYVLEGPIIDNPTPKLYSNTGGSTWALTTRSWTYDTGSGTRNARIYFTDGNVFDGRDLFEASQVGQTNKVGQFGWTSSMLENWRVDYSYGYTNIASVPADLKWATSIIARYYERLANFGSFSSQSDEEQSFSFDLDKLPIHVYTILNQYKRAAHKLGDSN